METPNPQQKGGGKMIWIILLLISAALNVIQYFHQTTVVNTYEQKVDTLVVERVNVEKELSDTKAELEKYRGISSNLDSLLNEAQAKIDEQSKKIKDISSRERNMKKMYEEVNKQLTDLRVLRDEYLSRIDSLLMANQKLVSEKQQLTTNVESLSKNLESTVATASVLKAEYLKIQSFKRKGNGKFVETALAKRTHKMEVCFDVLDNKIAKQGEKTVYLKITEPGGKPMGNRSTGSSTFKTVSGEEQMYASSQTIDFTGAKQSLCMSYEEQEEKMFPVGTYMVEIYIDGMLSGAGSYVLR
jgi:predicted  nucleic acid-binding Zn-ribbon protein